MTESGYVRDHMRMFVCGFLVVLPAISWAAPTKCPDPNTGEKKPIRVGQVKRGLKQVRKAMQKYGVHILDLPEAIQGRHAHLAEFLAQKKWCTIQSHATDIDDALTHMAIDQTFVSDKFSRVERWARTATESRKEKIDRHVANAAAQMADRRAAWTKRNENGE